jgi:hypothetical protein
LTDKFGIDDDDSDIGNDDDDERRGAAESKSFQLLNELSDLLMLPKDMLLEKSIRKEVCPSIGLQLVTRILCNFTPDEFCPDPVPSRVLEELNSEVCFILTKCCRLLASHTFIHRNVVVKKYLMLCRACWSDAPTKMCSAHFHALPLLLCTEHLRHQMRQRKWQT